MPERRFPPPWTVEELNACFVVPHCGQVLAYVRLYTFHTKPILFNRALRLADILFFFCAAPQPTIQVCIFLRGVNDGRESVPLVA